MNAMSAARPPRPLGVSLAIITSILLFSVLPLIQVGLVMVVQQHFASLDFPEGGPQPVAVGGDFLGVAPMTLIVQSALALAFLGLAAMTWRGRPGRIRFIFVGTVVLLTIVKIAVQLVQALQAQALTQGISSLDSLAAAFGRIQSGFEVLVMLYVVWYMNRGPARAFYRGHFLDTPPASSASSAP